MKKAMSRKVFGLINFIVVIIKTWELKENFLAYFRNRLNED
tara:strand:- start:113 stop:235 length:123 start_codon:yes stop_codon:yes gene_type:complete